MTSLTMKAYKPGCDHGDPRPGYGSGRVCTVEGCETRLSTYNPSDVCTLHPKGWKPIFSISSGKREPKHRICANEDCQAPFVTYDDRRKYCSETCQAHSFEVSKEKAKNRTRVIGKDLAKRQFRPTTLTVLTLFLDNPDESFYGTQVARFTGLNTSTVRRILTRFEEEGWFTSVFEGRKVQHPKRIFTMTPKGNRLTREVLALQGEI